MQEESALELRLRKHPCCEIAFASEALDPKPLTIEAVSLQALPGLSECECQRTLNPKTLNFFRGPYNKDPTILGTPLRSPTQLRPITPALGLRNTLANSERDGSRSEH